MILKNLPFKIFVIAGIHEICYTNSNNKEEAAKWEDSRI